MVPVGAVVLERPGGIDDQIGLLRTQRGPNVDAIEHDGQESGSPPVPRTETLGTGKVAAADEKLDLRQIGKQLCQTPTEYTVSAEGQDLYVCCDASLTAP